MAKISVLLALIALTLSTHAEGRWTIGEDRVYTNGTTVDVHKFGYFKDEEWCDYDLVFIEWSTYNDGIEVFKGVDVKVALRLTKEKEVAAVMSATLMNTFNVSTLMTLANFKTVILSKELSEDIRGSSSVELTFVGPDELISKLDIQSDTFDISGLASAYSQLNHSCQ